MSDRTYASRAAAPTLRQVWIDRAYQWRGIVPVILLVSLGPLIWYCNRIAPYVDMAGRPTFSASARVISVTPLGSRRGDIGEWDVVLKVEQELTSFIAARYDLAATLREGAVVPVVCQRGRSGRIYVVRIVPLASAQPAEKQLVPIANHLTDHLRNHQQSYPDR